MDYYKNEVRSVLYIKELAKSKAFYEGVLGLEACYGWDEGPEDCGVKYPAASGMIELCRREPPLPQGPATLMMQTVNVDECYATVRARGGNIIEPIADRPYGIRMFRMKDPDGNVVVLFSWLRDLEEPGGVEPTNVTGMFQGEYRAVAYVEQAVYDDCVRLYRDKLRLPITYTWDYGPGDRGVKFAIGHAGSTLEVLCRKDPDPQGEGTLMFEVQDVDACYEQVSRKQGVNIIEAPATRPYGLRCFRILDPDNNDVVLFSYLKGK